MHRIKWPVMFVVISLLIIFPRVLRLDAFWAADEKVWVAHTKVFTEQIATGHWTKLMQEAHPGITLLWLGALGLRFDSFGVQKLPIVLGQVIIIFMIWCVFARLWGRTGGRLVAIFLAVDPLLFAHMRIYEMESLLALFFVLCLGLLFLFRETKELRYLIFSGVAAALAVISKLPGVLLIPIAIILLAAEGYFENNRLSWRIFLATFLKRTGIWLLAFVIAAVVAFPSLALDFFGVMAQIGDFFSSDTFNEMHRMGPFYYLRTLFFYSSPLQILGLLLFLIHGLSLRRLTGKNRIIFHQAAVLLVSAILLVVMMSLGIKKGDRYILTCFLLLDVVAAGLFLLFKDFFFNQKTRLRFGALLLLFVFCTVWQEFLILKLFPDNLAYLNPLTKYWYADRRAGWGEGLEVAAAYLNEKPDAAGMTVASYYPIEFGKIFIGTAVSANRLDDSGVAYVVLYRAMKERGADTWETEAFSYFKDKKPEKIISFNGVDFVWIYKK